MDGFEDARVGVESAEMIDIDTVRGCKFLVTISNKVVKICGLLWREGEGGVAKIVES